MIKVSVKWQKEMFKDVEIDTSLSPYVFKCQLYDLTGVPPDRQKIMVKGGLMKDDGDWLSMGVKQGQKLMMMGTADEILKVPDKGPVFMEDLPEEEQVVAVGHTAGLYNLGNTCYMNSTVQCLHSVPELKSALINYQNSGRNDVDQTSRNLTIATRELFNKLSYSVKAVEPMQFWMDYSEVGVGKAILIMELINNIAKNQEGVSEFVGVGERTRGGKDLYMEMKESGVFSPVLQKKYPQFAQMQGGVYMQQDAEECWTQLVYTLSQSLLSVGSSESPEIMKALFGIELVSRIHCPESGEESSETESVYSLKCHISHEVNHLHEGLKHALKSDLEKVSPLLGRSAVYFKESRINGLPRYLTIQFVRFFWKRESNQKAKILRKVDYPLELDVYDLCSDDLRKSLEAPRQTLRNIEGKKLGLKTKETSSDKDVKMSDSEGREPSVAPNQEGKENQITGIYDLVAVLTHKGRSADSGHYVAWVKQENGKWVEFDDDKPTIRREEDITKLSGGGDWHMAYICMYKARTLPA